MPLTCNWFASCWQPRYFVLQFINRLHWLTGNFLDSYAVYPWSESGLEQLFPCLIQFLWILSAVAGRYQIVPCSSCQTTLGILYTYYFPNTQSCSNFPSPVLTVCHVPPIQALYSKYTQFIVSHRFKPSTQITHSLSCPSVSDLALKIHSFSCPKFSSPVFKLVVCPSSKYT
jgi:hypothetical protein